MEFNGLFLVNSLLLGLGLAMDAFSVSLANGLAEPCMKKGRMAMVAGIFGTFQGVMPLIGWLCVHTLLQHFQSFQRFIPWIALILLCYIGGKMIFDGIRGEDLCDEDSCGLSLSTLLLQGVATSIDALSVGFTIADYNFSMALLAVLIIGLVTFGLCFGGIAIGKRFGTKFAGKAAIFGGIVLIAVGLEIFLTGVL